MEPTPVTSRVLIADDDPSIRQLVCTIVKREKLDFDCAADGLEAIEHLQSRDYSVILLDLMMPRASGFDVIEHIRKNPPRQKPVILVITAYADQTFKEVDPDWVAGVIRKPFEVADIGDLVRLCVEGFQDQLANDLARSESREAREVAKELQRHAEFAASKPQGNDRRSN